MKKSAWSATILVVAAPVMILASPGPSIRVTQNDAAVEKGCTVDLGGMWNTDSSRQVVFTIYNAGDADLTYAVAAVSANGYALAAKNGTIAPRDWTSFAVSFNPARTAGQAYATAVTVMSNDTANSPYAFTLRSFVTASPAAVIKVCKGNLALSRGSTVNLGRVDTGYGVSKLFTFTLWNTGKATSLTYSVSGSGSGFSPAGTTSGSIAPGASADFAIQFTIGMVGDHYQTITVWNNDPDPNRQSFQFTLHVYVTSLPEPEINVRRDGVASIPNGSGSFTFADTDVNATSAAQSFTIENLGTSTLDVTANVDAAAPFSASPFSPTPTTSAPLEINEDGKASFTITFSPTCGGVSNVQVTVKSTNSSGVEVSYTFTVRGKGISAAPEAPKHLRVVR
jgi:hypothetical protein